MSVSPPAPVPTTPKPVVLDCDPGHDDAMALLLAYAAPEVDLLAVTTVAGNQTLDKCTRNAQRIMTLAGIREVPLAAGAASPLRRPLRVAADVHGASGLDGYDFGSPDIDVQPEHAVELLRQTLLDRHDPVTLIPTGPLTNIALLLERHPDVRDRIAEIVLMGGSTERGNVTPYAEANIYVDPEAAAAVFSSGLPVTMVGLNVTHQALVTEEVTDALRAVNTPLADACVALLTFFGSTYRQVWGFPAPPLHDPLAVARVIDPTLVQCVPAPVRVETTGEFTCGATVVDLHHLSGDPDNALVGTRIDGPRFWTRMVEAVRGYG